MADPVSNAIRRIAPSGRVSVFSNDSGRVVNPAYTSRIVRANPQGVAVAAAGKGYLANTANNRILVVW